MSEKIINIPYDYMSIYWEKEIKDNDFFIIVYANFELGFYKSIKGWVGKILYNPFRIGESGLCISNNSYLGLDTWELYDNDIISFVYEFLIEIEKKYYIDSYSLTYIDDDDDDD